MIQNRVILLNIMFHAPMGRFRTRPIDNVLRTKGLQERNTTVGWDDGGKISEIIN